MFRIRFAIITPLLTALNIGAQAAPSWTVRGDTSGAPAGCSSAAGIAAINAWFLALGEADSAGLVRAMTGPDLGFVFSIGKFTPADTFVVVRSINDLVGYARQRAVHHERMVVQAVTFNGWDWRGLPERSLQFGPIYVLRSADDLGAKPLPAVGKGMYWCNTGILALTLGPRPAMDPGPP